MNSYILQEKTVRSVLLSYDAAIVPKIEDLESYRESSRLIIIVSHTISKPNCPEFPGAEVVTEWWLETCLHESRFAEPSEHFTNVPFEEFPLAGVFLRMSESHCLVLETNICFRARKDGYLSHALYWDQVAALSKTDHLTRYTLFLRKTRIE